MTGSPQCSTVALMHARLRRLRPDLVRLDWALAVVLTVALWLETWLGGNAQGHRIALSIGGALTTAAVAFRRRYPGAVGIGAALLSVLMQSAWPSAEVTYGIAWICNMYGFAVWTKTRVFAIGLSLFVVAALISALLPFGSGGGVHGLKRTLPFLVASTVVMLIVRQVIGARDRRAQLAERERDLAAREAVVEERARIARELHDVIAHNVSMMVVQAGAERRVLDPANDSTREVLETVEEIGRGALTEMRRLVGMLRTDGAESLRPQPGLDDVGSS